MRLFIFLLGCLAFVGCQEAETTTTTDNDTTQQKPVEVEKPDPIERFVGGYYRHGKIRMGKIHMFKITRDTVETRCMGSYERLGGTANIVEVTEIPSGIRVVAAKDGEQPRAYTFKTLVGTDYISLGLGGGEAPYCRVPNINELMEEYDEEVRGPATMRTFHEKYDMDIHRQVQEMTK